MGLLRLAPRRSRTTFCWTRALRTLLVLSAYGSKLKITVRDLWILDAGCNSKCSGLPTFDHQASSTFRNLSTPFQIKYGSGSASGSLVQDTVNLAGFGVVNQTFGASLYCGVPSYPSEFLTRTDSVVRSNIEWSLAKSRVRTAGSCVPIHLDVRCEAHMADIGGKRGLG